MFEESDLDHVVAKTLQARLKRYVAELRTDITELAAGLKISRPVIIRFMNAEATAIQLPPITPAKIVNLWQALTAPEKTSLKQLTKQYRRTPSDPETLTSEDIRDQAIAQRSLLKERGPDELLIAAGYLPQQMRWIGVSPERYPQMLQTTLLLDNSLLDFDTFMRITQQQLEDIVKTISAQDACLVEPVDTISRTLSLNPTINPEFRAILLGKYQKACARILVEGHRAGLTRAEALGLFSTILSNEMSRHEHNELRLRVINLEFHPLSFSVSMQQDRDPIDEQIRQISLAAEKKLGNFSNSVDRKTESLIPPVIEAVITCGYHKENGDKNQNIVCFNYINCGTVLSTAIHSVALHLGFQQAIRTLQRETRDLGFDIGSLVKCTTTFGYGDDLRYSQGSWVDRDLLKTTIQSLLLAGEKWIHQQLTEHKMEGRLFSEVFQAVSDLRGRLNDVRKKFHGYRFLVENKHFAEIVPEKISDSLDRISKDAKAHLDHHIGASSSFEIWQTFSAELWRIYILSQLHKFRMMNMTGDLKSACAVQEALELAFDIDDHRAYFEPIHLLFQAENKLLALSAGTQLNLFASTADFWQDFVNDAEIRIFRFLNRRREVLFSSKNPANALGIDIYQSLGTINSIAGRWLFYLGKTAADMDLACELFLKSSHYFSRVGLKQRVARCLALAGRTQVRAGDLQKAEYFVKTARHLIESNLHMGQRDAYKQSVLSEIYLLEGELALLLKSQPGRGLLSSLKGLKGAMWMGLARRTADNLYNLSRCAQQLGNHTVETDLREVFNVLWETSRSSSEAHKRQRLNPLKSKISDGVVDLLFNIKQQRASSDWHEVAEQFQLAASNVWNVWRRSGGGNARHPIAELIDHGQFLTVVKH